MTLLIASIACPDGATMLACAERAMAGGAELVELRLDAIETDSADVARAMAVLPRGRWIATCRSPAEGGVTPLPAEKRQEYLRAALAQGADFVDVELASMKSLGQTLADVDRKAPSECPGIILSAHDFQGIPTQINQWVARASEAIPKAIVKVAWKCTDISENFVAFELLREAPGRRMVICMGEKGILSRVLARKLGAFGTFCSPTPEIATAPGQITLGDMLNLYGWQRQTDHTKVFGVIGSPVSHSMSPAIFNAQFAAHAYDGVYLPLRIDSEEELIRFLTGCRERPWLDVRGFSVTVPHKTHALRWAKEEVEPLALRIGAVNTLLFDGGKTRAYNTDYAGALSALEFALDASAKDWRGLPIAVLGAGGVARAVVAGFCDRGCHVTVYNRSPDRACELATDFGCDAQPWEERIALTAKVVINCTSVGMMPHVEDTPLPADTLRPEMTVFDTVYNPIETCLLRNARMVGCQTVSGVAMFVYQAAAQYRIWTGKDADTELMTRIVTNALAGV